MLEKGLQMLDAGHPQGAFGVDACMEELTLASPDWKLLSMTTARWWRITCLVKQCKCKEIWSWPLTGLAWARAHEMRMPNPRYQFQLWGAGAGAGTLPSKPKQKMVSAARMSSFRGSAGRPTHVGYTPRP